MSDHTPGPWSIGPSPFAESRDSLAILEPNGDIVFDFGDYPDLRQRANAALIAKAPAMRTLLRQAVDQFPDLEAGNGDIVDWLAEFVQRAHEVIDR